MICLKRESEDLLYNCNVSENGYEDIVLSGRGIFVIVFLFRIWWSGAARRNKGSRCESGADALL